MVGGTKSYIEAVLRRYSIANVPENAGAGERVCIESFSRKFDLKNVPCHRNWPTVPIYPVEKEWCVHIIYHAGLITEVEYSPPPPTEFRIRYLALRGKGKIT
jgi:hypothetical protein